MRRGFTSIEILIVLALVALLVVIAVPAYRGLQLNAKQSRAQADLKVLKIAIESYYKNNYNAYPNDSFGMGTVPNWESTLLEATPRILEQMIYDPFRVGKIEFQYASAGDYFIIWSYGPNGIGEITGIDPSGEIQGTVGDDIYETNTTRW